MTQKLENDRSEGTGSQGDDAIVPLKSRDGMTSTLMSL